MSNSVAPADGEFRIVVVGSEGHGKSTVSNALLGSKPFVEGTKTTESQLAEKSKGGVTVKVVDTPDIKTDDWVQKTKKVEVQRWKDYVAPEAHMLLLVVKGDAEYTEEEFKTYRQVRRFWGKGSAREKLIVVFTFCDGQDVEEVGDRMESTSPKWVGKILRDSGGRYIVFKGKNSGDLLDEVTCENNDDSDDEEEQEVQVVEDGEGKKKREKPKCRKPKGGRGMRYGHGDGKGRRHRGGGGGGGLLGCLCSFLCCFCKTKGGGGGGRGGRGGIGAGRGTGEGGAGEGPKGRGRRGSGSSSGSGGSHKGRKKRRGSGSSKGSRGSKGSRKGEVCCLFAFCKCKCMKKKIGIF